MRHCIHIKKTRNIHFFRRASYDTVYTWLQMFSIVLTTMVRIVFALLRLHVSPHFSPSICPLQKHMPCQWRSFLMYAVLLLAICRRAIRFRISVKGSHFRCKDGWIVNTWNRNWEIYFQRNSRFDSFFLGILESDPSYPPSLLCSFTVNFTVYLYLWVVLWKQAWLGEKK